MPTFGMVVRSADSEHFYFMHYDLLYGQIIAYAADPVPRWVELGRQRGVPISRDEWHRAKVWVRGSRMTAYLDGRRLLTVQDSRFAAGLVGLRCDAGLAEFRRMSAQGQVRPLQKEWVNKVSKRDWVVVCDGGRGKFAAWPDLLWLPRASGRGRLLCCLYQGYAHGSPPTDEFPNCGKMVSVFSDDWGKTWSKPMTTVDTEADDHDGHLALLKDGRLLCNYFAEQFYQERKGKRVRIEGNAAWRFDICLIESRDGGKTWREPRVVATPWKYCSATAGKIIELPEGDLLMPVYGWEAGGANAGVGVVRSGDGGQTWGAVKLLVSGLPAGSANEMALLRLDDGRLLALIRPQMLQAYSSDEGRTWTAPVQAGVAGHAPCLIQTREGRLVYGIRTAGQGYATGVVVSDDRGATWQGPYQVDTVSGAYPGLAELPDGSIYIVYYEEGAGSRIRGKRFRLQRDGIELLPLEQWR